MELEELLKGLEQALNQEQQQEQQQAQQQQKQEEVSDVVSPSSQDEAEKKLQAYKGLGSSIFLSRNATLPNIQKLYPFIENRANLMLLQDLQKGVIKDSYDMYLEEAKDFVLKEILTTAKNYVEYKTKPSVEETPAVATTKPNLYKMQDYYNDYKLALEDGTIKHFSVVFDDGVKTAKGIKTFGEGKAEFHKKIQLN